jgi:hypothetical protein
MTTTDQILKRAQELHTAKMAALAPLAELVALREELRRRLAESDDAYGRAYADAEVAGWSAVELAGIGAETPQRRPKGRPRKPRTPRLQSGTAQADEGASPLPSQSSPPAHQEAVPS